MSALHPLRTLTPGDAPISTIADVRRAWEDLFVTHHRAVLLDALRRVRDGGTFSNEELLSIIPDPSSLEELERAAWYRLSHWADDDDIRKKDTRYADMQERQIDEALADLAALEAGYLPSEVSRGEHQAWQIPLWGCVLVGSVSVAAIIFWSPAYFNRARSNDPNRPIADVKREAIQSRRCSVSLTLSLGC